MGVTFPGMQQSFHSHSREWTVPFGSNAPEVPEQDEGGQAGFSPPAQGFSPGAQTNKGQEEDLEPGDSLL